MERWRFRGNAHHCRRSRRQDGSRSGGTAYLPIALSSRVQRLANLDLEPARRRRIVTPVRHLVGKVALARGVAARLVMRVPIALAVADFLHQAGRRVAQMQGYLERA